MRVCVCVCAGTSGADPCESRPSQSQPQIVCVRDVFLLLRLVVLSLLVSDPWALVGPHCEGTMLPMAGTAVHGEGTQEDTAASLGALQRGGGVVGPRSEQQLLPPPFGRNTFPRRLTVWEGYCGLSLPSLGKNCSGAAPCVRWAEARLFL